MPVKKHFRQLHLTIRIRYQWKDCYYHRQGRYTHCIRLDLVSRKLLIRYKITLYYLKTRREK